MKSDPCWYVIYVRSRHEFKVAERLTDAGVENFLPIVERVSRWKDRRKLVTFPLFSGYLFVHIDDDPFKRLTVLKATGVVRFLGLSESAHETVPDERIMALKRLVESKEQIDPYPYLRGGRRVRINRGPLAGIEGTLVERLGQHMLVVNVDLIRQGAALRINASDVEQV